MDEEYGGTFITIEDEEGNETELELLGDMDYNGQTYVAFLPGPDEMDENDPDYGMIILKSITDENGEELFEQIESEDELNDVYERFMAILFEDEDELGISQ